MDDGTENRRPLKARDWGIMQRAARWLARRNIPPNWISLASIVFAALAGLCLLNLPGADFVTVLALALLAVVFILGRALCNLFDGMVAIEGGKKTRSGELFNDIPDRIADPLIIVAAGYAAAPLAWGPALGWCASLLAVMTAYIRTLARSIGAPPDFRGPMSKVPRMIAIALACAMTPLEALFWQRGTSFAAALAVIGLGCVVTIWNRARAAYLYLEGQRDV